MTALQQQGSRGLHEGTYKPDAAPDVSPNERVTVPEERRLYLNGETKACMEHVQTLKKKYSDTSVDEKWEIVEKPWTDRYILATTAIWQTPKAIVTFPLLYILQLPVLILLRLYLAKLPDLCDMPDRGSIGYRLFVALVILIGLPVIVVVLFSYFWDCIGYYIFGLLHMLATCGFGRYCKSCRAIDPWRNGPYIWCHMNDVVTALMGQVSRQGILQSSKQMCGMWIMIPWLKYYLNVNPFIYDLSDRFVQQISTTWQDMTVDQLIMGGFRIFGRTKQKVSVRKVCDEWPFAPHYPFPPPWKRWSIGIQATNVAWLFVHTTHGCSVHGGSTEQFMASNSYLSPGCRVMLWYNNPYHFLTGWVEASITAGVPQQTDKDRGGEHPMWLCAGRSRLSAARTKADGSFTGAARVDAFFDKWLPMLTHEVRCQSQGKEDADKYNQGVISKEGISRPSSSSVVHPVPRVEAGPGWGAPTPIPLGAFEDKPDENMRAIRMGQLPFPSTTLKNTAKVVSVTTQVVQVAAKES